MHTIHTLEISDVLARRRREINDLRRVLEGGLQSSQDEKDREISAMREQMALISRRSFWSAGERSWGGSERRSEHAAKT